MTEKHDCGGNLPKGGYGAAIESCEEDDDGYFWAGNGEYSSRVMFCPYCGTRAKKLPLGVESELSRMRRDYPNSEWVKEQKGKPDLHAERLAKIYDD